MLHLAPGGDPVRLDIAGRAVPETQEGAADVVHLDGAGLAVRAGAAGDGGDAIAHHAGDRPQQEFGGGKGVAADIGQRAAARRIVAEGEGAGRVGHVILGMDAAVAADLAQFPRRDHLARDMDHRVAEVVEADLRPDPRRFGGLGHPKGVCGQRGQRLLAIDMLARGDGGQRHLLVQGVGGGDVHDVDLGVVDHAAPVGGGMGEAPAVGGAAGGGFGHVGHGMQRDVMGQVEHLLRGGEAEDMGLAHEAGADQAKAEFRFFRHGRCSG